MNTPIANSTTRFGFPKRFDADRFGVAASVLCAIHCGVAPFLLLALPAFGKIWAHPASHALVAIFIVPLAIFSIRNGYQQHRKRWVIMVAGTGICCVLVGAVLPALTKGSPSLAIEETAETSGATSSGGSESSCGTGSEAAVTEGNASETSVGCIDNCCPSAQISESGEISLHIPPAAIVTTLGGLFLIVAHAGNLMGCRHCCSPTTA